MKDLEFGEVHYQSFESFVKYCRFFARDGFGSASVRGGELVSAVGSNWCCSRWHMLSCCGHGLPLWCIKGLGHRAYFAEN